MTITTEKLNEIYENPEQCSYSEIQEMAAMLANREAQPVQGLELAGWQFKSVNGDWLGILDELGKNQAVHEGCEVREVYTMTDSPNDRDEVREAHAEWSRSTFGNVGPIGPLKHLSKEALEAAAKPDDLSEWADMQFLLWDAQRRAGITDEQITQAMIEKLKVNMARQWPEPKDGEPRLHITAPPAPAVPPEATPENIENLLADITLFFTAGSLSHGGSVMFAEVWNACRAAMLAAVPEYDILEDYRAEMLKRVTFGGDGKSSCNANSPEIPEGWKLVPVEPTKEMINAALAAGCASIRSAYREMLAAAPESGNDHDTRR